ncbi:MAG: hypothetical protein LBD30_09065 [Verrucomicrobiales bacterium]|nr:hypothetical protein [Verrucomicrobiales bacterium]
MKTKRWQKYLPVGALGISLTVHLAIFLGISGIIIIQAVAPKIIPAGEFTPATSADTAPEMPPEPEDLDVSPPASNAEELSSNMPPTFSVEQISSSVVTAVVPTFTIAPPAAADAGGVTASLSAGTSGAAGRRSTAPRSMPNPFGGNVNAEDGAMIGHMYDLKQTADRQPTSMAGDATRAWNDPKEVGANNECRQTILKFFNSGWQESVFEKYYKVEKPIGIFQLFIPRQDAELAPRAFNADRLVKARRWVIVYKGSFTAPASGTFRFVGNADDEMAVRLGKRVVLEVGHNLLDKIKREQVGGNSAANRVFGGEWFELEAGQTYPLSILINETPGGAFQAFLLIQKKGGEYAWRQGKQELGPALPVFQLSPVNMPRGYQPEGNAPSVAKEAFICQ